MAPLMDVHELANLLQQLNFRVVSLLDLTREEMLAAIDKFIQLLDKGVYGQWDFSICVDFTHDFKAPRSLFLIKSLDSMAEVKSLCFSEALFPWEMTGEGKWEDWLVPEMV